MEAGGLAAESELELANAACARFDVDAAVAHLSAAIRSLTAAGKACRAAMACAQLGDIYANFMGNQTAARAWFARASRLVDDQPPCVEQGWVAVAAMGCEVDDPAVLLSRAEFALDRARQFGDVNLETKALADAGLAHVQAGRIKRGMELLDEAMALACSAADNLDAAGKSVCSFFTACYYAADFQRAGSWAKPLRKQGLIGIAPIAPIFLSNHCDTVQATLLFELGQWGDAEAILTRAIRDFETTIPVPSWHPTIALADLRVRQGRLADAEMLLLGRDGHLEALLPTARLHLARGDHALALATARRGLRAVGEDRLRAAELLAIVTGAELASGNHRGALTAADRLDNLTSGIDVPGLRARAVAARARVLSTTGDLTGAVAAIEGVIDGLDRAGLPWLHSTLLLDLARLYEKLGDRAAAVVEAKSAAAKLATLDVVVPHADLALLDRLGAGAPGTQTPSPPDMTATLHRDGRWWEVGCGQTTVRLQDSKGLRYLAVLVADAGVERHVLDLVDRVEGVSPAGPARRSIGDAGELLDGRARAAYRRRIEALRSEVDDALSIGDENGALARQEELDPLVRQLAEAFGLGGRPRHASSAAERARLNVTRALRSATAKLAEALPGPGAALDRGLRTGMYCVYEQQPDDVRWIVHL